MRHILLMLALAVSASGQQEKPPNLQSRLCVAIPGGPLHCDESLTHEDWDLLRRWQNEDATAKIVVSTSKPTNQPVWLIDGRRAYLTCPDDRRQDCTLSVNPHSKKPKKKAKPSGLTVYGNLYHKFCPPYDPCELPGTYYIRDFKPSGHAVSTHTKAGK